MRLYRCSVARMHDDRIAPFPALSHALRTRMLFLWLMGFCLACTSEPADGELGALTLGLTTQSEGVTYRLTDARFALSGPTPRELATGAENELSISLPAGAYGLTLHEGYTLTRIDGDGARLPARLVSPNPLPLLIAASETTRATLRFVLADGVGLTLGAGTLQVGVEVGDASVGAGSEPAHAMGDAATPTQPALSDAARACRQGLRISEVDYEQPSSDDSEFIELINAGTCDAPLDGLRLELVNGTGGKVYGRYALSDAAPNLTAGQLLVIGDPTLLATLPATSQRLPLSGSGLQNGPDGVRLVDGPTVLDAIAYQGAVPGSGEGSPSLEDDGASSLARCLGDVDQQDNARDFQRAAPTPGTLNACTSSTPRGDVDRTPPAQNTSATMPSSSSQR